MVDAFAVELLMHDADYRMLIKRTLQAPCSVMGNPYAGTLAKHSYAAALTLSYGAQVRGQLWRSY